MSVRRWELVELELSGAAESVIFSHEDGRAVVDPFQHGDRLLARFAPDREGVWRYAVIDSTGAVLDEGALECRPAGIGDHGPLVAAGTRFRHADGTGHVPLPTTALWWHRQSDPVREQTLAALRNSPITAVRLSVLLPGAGDWPGDDELDRVERAVIDLAADDRQAELVIFGDGTALDRPGWQSHLRRVVARFAAFPTVSWCLAVDADRSGIEPAHWDEVLRLLAELDHGHRLCTIHAGPDFDFGDRRITHCNVRTDHARSSSILNDAFAKPAILDGAIMEGNAPISSLPEMCEGDAWGSFPELVEGPTRSSLGSIEGPSSRPSTGSGHDTQGSPAPHPSNELRASSPTGSWHLGAGCSTGSGQGVGPRPEPVEKLVPAANLTAEDVVLHAWETAVRGGYAAHGEWFVGDDDHGPWWADGGDLRGEALPRLAFLREVLAAIPGEPRYLRLRPDASTLGVPEQYYLQYLGAHRFRSRSFDLPDASYRVEVINTWDLTVEEVLRPEGGRFTVQLPPRLYHAIRVTRC